MGAFKCVTCKGTIKHKALKGAQDLLVCLPGCISVRINIIMFSNLDHVQCMIPFTLNGKKEMQLSYRNTSPPSPASIQLNMDGNCQKIQRIQNDKSNL